MAPGREVAFAVHRRAPAHDLVPLKAILNLNLHLSLKRIQLGALAACVAPRTLVMIYCPQMVDVDEKALGESLLQVSNLQRVNESSHEGVVPFPTRLES